MIKSYISWFYFFVATTFVITLVSFTTIQSPQEEINQSYEKFKEYIESDPEQALIFAVNAYDLAEQYQDSLWIMKSSRAAGYLYNTFGNYDTGYYYLLKSIEYGEYLNDQEHLMRVYNDAGLNRRNISKFDNALSHFFSSLKIREENDDKLGLAIIYNNIGLIYYDLSDFKKSVEYHSKSLSINQELNNSTSSVINRVNIGLCYMGNEEYSIAENYFKQVLEICRKECSVDVNIQALGGLGILNYKQGFLEVSQKYFNASNEISLENDILKYLPSNYSYLAHILFDEKKVDSALYFLNTSQEYALELENVEEIMNNLKLYSTIYAEARDFENAFFYHEQYVSFRDSTYNNELIQNLSDIHVNLQKSKDETIIKGLDNEISAITQQTIMFALTTLVVSFLLFLMYRNNKVIKRINTKLGEANLTIENQNISLNELNHELDDKVKRRTESLLQANNQLKDSRAELDNFIYKTSHDIKGPLATLKGMCNVASIELKDEEALGYISKIYDTATRLNNILSQLQVVNDINHMELNEEIIDFDVMIEKASMESLGKYNGDKPIDFRFDNQLNSEFKLDVFLIDIIISNLISNGYKFYNDSKNIESFVSCQISDSDKMLSITVTDNGIGIEKDKAELVFNMFTRFSDRNRQGGIGLYLVKCAIDRLGGGVSVEQTDDGHTRFIVNIPLISESTDN